MFLSNQILGFIDYQYLPKEAFNVIDFFSIEKVITKKLLLRVLLLVGCSQACPVMHRLP